jgi:biotin transport system substrate-specific component
MNAATPNLARKLLPNRSLTRDISLIVGGAALTTAASQVQIPWQPVPFTLQTLAVMLIGLTMGARLGTLSQLAYLGLGAVGAPVFAGFTGGPARLLGPTGGYLASFVFVVGLLGWMSDRGWTKSVIGSAAALALGALLNLSLGTLWLSCYLGLGKAFWAGFAPFVGIEAAKAAIAIPVVRNGARAVKSYRSAFGQLEN